jgi:hypothetical protein
MPRQASLTGAWSGAYRYPRGPRRETVFNAQIEEVGGAFTGAVQEPNLLRPELGPIVTSDIEGVRVAQAVSFTKFYNGSGGMNHAVRYEGSANAALTRIEGRWTVPNSWSGTFFMSRDDEGEAVEAEEQVEETIEQRR